MKVLVSVFNVILWLQLTAPTPPLISLDMIKHLMVGNLQKRRYVLWELYLIKKKISWSLGNTKSIYVLVLKNISIVRSAHSWNIFQHSKRNFLSPCGHV